MKRSEIEVQIEKDYGVKKSIIYKVVDAEEFEKGMNELYDNNLDGVCDNCIMEKFNKVIISTPTTIQDWMLKKACIERLQASEPKNPIDNVLDYVAGNKVLYDLLLTVFDKYTPEEAEELRVKAKEEIDKCADELVAHVE